MAFRTSEKEAKFVFNKNKFREKLVGAGITMEQLASVIGINPTTLYRKASGESEFTRSEMQCIRHEIGLDSSDMDAIFFAQELA